MPVRRRLLTLLTCALLAAGAAPAAAQEDEFEPLSPEPPPGIGEVPTNDGNSEPPEQEAKPELPASGAEPMLTLLIGVGMISAGSGLRLRLIRR